MPLPQDPKILLLCPWQCCLLLSERLDSGLRIFKHRWWSKSMLVVINTMSFALVSDWSGSIVITRCRGLEGATLWSSFRVKGDDEMYLLLRGGDTTSMQLMWSRTRPTGKGEALGPYLPMTMHLQKFCRHPLAFNYISRICLSSIECSLWNAFWLKRDEICSAVEEFQFAFKTSLQRLYTLCN